MLSRALLDMEVSCLEALRAVELGLAGGFSDELGMAGAVLRQVCGMYMDVPTVYMIGVMFEGQSQ